MQKRSRSRSYKKNNKYSSSKVNKIDKKSSYSDSDSNSLDAGHYQY